MVRESAKISAMGKNFLYVIGILLLAYFIGSQIIDQNYKIMSILLLGLATLLLILKSPVFGLYLIAAITPLNQLQQFDIPLFSSVIRVIGAITLVSFLIHHFVAKKDRLIKTELFFPLAIFVFAYVVGLFRAYDPKSALELLISLTMYFLLYLLVVNLVKDQKTIKRMLLVFIIVATGLALFGIVQYFRGETLFPPEMGRFGAFRLGKQRIVRVIGVFKNPNAFAYNYVLVIPLIVGILLTEKRRLYQGIIMGLLGLCTFCLFITFSRSAFLALWVSILIILYFIKGYQKVIAVASLLGVFVILYIFSPNILHILKYRMSPTVHDIGIEQRIELVKGGIDIFLTHPLIGAGIGNSPTILGRYTYDYRHGPHNNLVAVLVETGLLGFIPFILIFIMFTKKILKAMCKTNNRSSRIILVSILASIWGYFVNGLFHTSIGYGLWWMVLGLGIAQAYIVERSMER